MQVEGPFDVVMAPQVPDPGHEAAGIARMLLDKRYHGPLEATSTGQMLAYRTAIEGSAGYVAMERVTGTLAGRSGAFTLQHYGVLTRDAGELILTVVPDSGTDELTGLSGRMAIIIANGTHRYRLDFEPGDAP